MRPRVKSIVPGAGEFAAHALLLLSLFVAAGSICRAQTNIAEFPLLSSLTTWPRAITYGPDGAYWFVEYANNRIGRIETVSNTITEITLLTNRNTYGAASADPFGITIGPDTNLWFTEFKADQIGRINTTTSNYVEFPLTNGDSGPRSIVAGPDGNLWFVEFNYNRIAAINPNSLTNTNGGLQFVHDFGPFGGDITHGSRGTNAQIYGLTTGPDGKLWFTQTTYGVIGNIDPNGTQTNLFYLPDTNAQPTFIVPNTDGALWFTEYVDNKIGRITTAGQITEFPVPILAGYGTPNPGYILASGDGNIWFSEFSGSAVARITPGGIFTIFPTPTVGSFPNGLATGVGPGADSNIWFAEFTAEANGLAYQSIARLLVAQSLNLSVPVSTIVGTNFTGVIANFQNSTPTNSVSIAWGDGNISTLSINNLSTSNTSASVTNVVVTGSQTNTNTLMITQTTFPANGTNANFSVSVNHTYAVLSNFTITITVVDGRIDTAVANIPVNNGQPLFTGEHVANGALVLSFIGSPGRTYTVQSTATLTPPVWMSNGTVTVPTNSTTAQITNTLSPANRFFRLSYP